jgi:hypothetical protein
MRFFVALAVFAGGVGLYAVAALLFDRRRILRAWATNRRLRLAAKTNPGVQLATIPAVSSVPLAAVIVGCVLVGSLLVFGSCAGLILW